MPEEPDNNIGDYDEHDHQQENAPANSSSFYYTANYV
jgi:hypothetical protein